MMNELLDEATARTLFSLSTTTNATTAAILGGSVLFLGLNAAFALAFLNKGDDLRQYHEYQRRRKR